MLPLAPAGTRHTHDIPKLAAPAHLSPASECQFASVSRCRQRFTARASAERAYGSTGSSSPTLASRMQTGNWPDWAAAVLPDAASLHNLSVAVAKHKQKDICEHATYEHRIDGALCTSIPQKRQCCALVSIRSSSISVWTPQQQLSSCSADPQRYRLNIGLPWLHCTAQHMLVASARPYSVPCHPANCSHVFWRRYNYCPIPESGEDAVLFASLALVVACLLSGRLSALWVFIAGDSACM